MESLYFTDGKKRIDMVLAFEDHDGNPKKVKKREVFEKHLRDQGLHLELETKSVRFFLFLKQDARITEQSPYFHKGHRKNDTRFRCSVYLHDYWL